jgi:hypothetical protein
MRGQITDFKIPGSNTKNREWVGETAMETTVAIDRATGRVIHPIIGNTSFNYVTLLNEGSALAWSFKALADSGAGGNVRYYEVHEHVLGELNHYRLTPVGLRFECNSRY